MSRLTGGYCGFLVLCPLRRGLLSLRRLSAFFECVSEPRELSFRGLSGEQWRGLGLKLWKA